MYPEISGFHRVEVPTLSGGDGRDAFYDLCRRSSVIDDLITRLDFHPLSIDLLASSIRENDWDESTFLKAWDDGGTGGLEMRYRQTLRDAIEPSFRSPTIRNLGTAAREALNAIAAFPGGVEESRLEGMFPGITGIEVAVDVLCKFSLLYHQGGCVKVLSPFQFYFLDSMLEPAQRVEVIRCDATNSDPAEACTSLSSYPCYTRMVTLFEGLPIYTRGPNRPPVTPPHEGPLARANWIRKFQSMRSSEHNDSDPFWTTPLTVL